MKVETEVKFIADKHFCIYCGTQVKQDFRCVGNHGRDTEYYYECNCDGANRASEIDIEIYKLHKEKSDLAIGYSAFQELEYQAKLADLNKRYNKNV